MARARRPGQISSATATALPLCPIPALVRSRRRCSRPLQCTLQLRGSSKRGAAIPPAEQLSANSAARCGATLARPPYFAQLARIRPSATTPSPAAMCTVAVPCTSLHLVELWLCCSTAAAAPPAVACAVAVQRTPLSSGCRRGGPSLASPPAESSPQAQLRAPHGFALRRAAVFLSSCEGRRWRGDPLGRGTGTSSPRVRALTPRKPTPRPASCPAIVARLSPRSSLRTTAAASAAERTTGSRSARRADAGAAQRPRSRPRRPRCCARVGHPPPVLAGAERRARRPRQRRARLLAVASRRRGRGAGGARGARRGTGRSGVRHSSHPAWTVCHA